MLLVIMMMIMMMGENPTEHEVFLPVNIFMRTESIKRRIRCRRSSLIDHLPKCEVLNLMLEADLDGNGTIEFPEFLELMKEKYGSDDQESDLR